ncbi:23S rRNA (cytidine1920-2'-O)/16S rRNA (cytidine1409-2'-O)-methyltransferase [Alkalibacterium subtropicum]|uniref:23S rRNA (Cytidine1920-2'-O)/16S rRNA (Cytidine1409-2'-O)-methyltransferase n=1 Tax=Alkalibacterium subtropicum TaxID=753702 RepID=A0A1I1GXP4_9LACT|nr:TlyA family RNA methyltransferase [Alkalibacterium subtropicum]SFC13750.1 23S rRNA (cytidine1920-2'-O)/16S rRNA (cytidine1409-2'-O)-methyltransferase [Alkalibacterium subtropicum]
MKKQRADDLLIAQGWAEDREQAKRFIMSGKAYTEKEEQIFTAGEKWPGDTTVYIKGADQLYVSRGGRKLEKALEVFGIDLTGRIVLDIGASTGGFTDVCLQQGAKLVYALDVGTNQLAWKLRIDKRVEVMEQTNFRHVTIGDFKKGRPEVATIDVSFISLQKIFPTLKTILAPGGEVVALIKPQFEAQKEDVGEKGIITDRSVHEYVVRDSVDYLYDQGFQVKRVIPSPIKGGKGNKEFLAHIALSEKIALSKEEHMNSAISDALFVD